MYTFLRLNIFIFFGLFASVALSQSESISVEKYLITGDNNADTIAKVNSYRKAMHLAFQLSDDKNAYTAITKIQRLKRYLGEIDSFKFYNRLGRKKLNQKSSHQISLLLELATVLRQQNEADSSLFYALHAEKLSSKLNDTAQLGRTYTVIGNHWYYQQDFEKAFANYSKADSIYSRSPRFMISKERAQTLNYLGYAVRLASGYDNALEYYIKSRDMHKELGNLQGYHEVNIAIAQAYVSQKKFKEALDILNKAVPYNKKKGQFNSYTYALIVRGYAYLQVKDFLNAEKDYLAYYQFAHDTNNDLLIGRSKDYMGYFYNEAGEYVKALKYYNEALDYFAKNKRFKKEILALEAIIDVNKKLKKYEQVAEVYEQYIVKSKKYDSLRIEEQTVELETKYQTQKKEQEIALLKAENELSIQQKANQRTLFMAGGSLLGLLSLGLFFLYRNKQKTHQRLKELDTMKSNFFANISHEFRTPLTLISGPLQNRLEQPSLADKDRDELHMMLNNSKQLTSLVDQLLDLSKIEAGSMQLQVQQGNALKYIAGLAANFEHAAKQKGIAFLTNINHDDAPIWYDSDALSKITSNLLSNAMKFTPKKGSVLCNAHIAGGKLHLTVKNTGEGLTDDEQKKVFDRFYQTAHNQKGTGIGLALVKELVALYHGTIQVDSIPDQWTSFSVVLPTAIKGLGHAHAEAAGTSLKDEVIRTEITTAKKTAAVQGIDIDVDSEQPVMLIVEDNHDLRQLLKANFETAYQVLLAKDGVEGVAMAIEHIPEIIISDVMMPKKDGMALTQQLKQDERTSHIPIILLTAKASEQSKIEGLEFKADDYITKPFNQKILATRINNLIETRKALQKRYSQEVILRPMDIAVTPPDQRFLEKVQAVLDQKLIESDFSVEEFSTAVGMSRMQLHRKLKALTGLSATEFVRSQRLKLAAQLLKKSEINVSQVGYSVGFNDHSYFTKCFKELYKCTPSEYAKRDWG